MKTLYFVIVMISFLIASCASNGSTSTQSATNFIKRQHVTTITKQVYPAKNPDHVTLFKKQQKPTQPYRVIGIASVSKYNLIGIARKEETIQEMMQNLAASIGGDGLINLSSENDKIKAHVIAYQKILI